MKYEAVFDSYLKWLKRNKHDNFSDIYLMAIEHQKKEIELLTKVYLDGAKSTNPEDFYNYYKQNFIPQYEAPWNKGSNEINPEGKRDINKSQTPPKQTTKPIIQTPENKTEKNVLF